jgi:hypothetical protein
VRPKSLIRKRGRINGVRHHTAQGEIIPDGAIAYWQSVYDAHGSYSERRDVRATLNDLATINDAEVKAAIRAIDAATECEMLRGVWHWYRRDSAGAIPAAAFDLENYGAPEIREFAQVALAHFKASTGGRPNTKKLDVEFAAWLAMEYQRQTGTRPTTITDGNTPFMQFAVSQFAAAGRRSRDLTKILREGIRAALAKPKRIYRAGENRAVPNQFQGWPFRGK